MIKFVGNTLLFLLISTIANAQTFLADRYEATKADHSVQFILPTDLHANAWSNEAQPIFWKQVMRLSPDSLLVNIAATRQIVDRIGLKKWHERTEEGKQGYRDSIREIYGLDSTARIFFTNGKNNFYRFDLVMQQLTRGIELFEEYNTDPWYAQAILLIESPGQLKKSVAGAYGAFQLMPGVARNQGLVVNKSRDERADFDRSAYGAARLLRTICIPEARKILNGKGIQYNEQDMWFRLFVLHIYHAGAGNVAAVMNAIAPIEGGKDLIKQMWVTSAGNFGNNSQNYTQLALAATLILEEIIKSDYAQIYSCMIDERMN